MGNKPLLHKWGTKLNYMSGHGALINIENKGLSDIQNYRELRLLESITPYWIKVEHIKGSNNSFADALSRLPSKTEPFQNILNATATKRQGKLGLM